VVRNRSILLVEDDSIIAADLSYCLEEFGYKIVEVASNADDAVLYVKKYKPDLVLMDICLEGSKDGTEVVEIIQKKLTTPVVYLTSHSDEETLLKASSTNPFGYVIKPFDLNQLNSTILVAISKFEEQKNLTSGKIVQLSANYRYDYTDEVLYYLGEKVNFTTKEKRFFDYMMKNLNKTVCYEKIIKNIWLNQDIPTSTLRSLVRRVRDKLHDNIIENISSKGYRIQASINL